jgi:hypothetical protein
MIFEIVGPLIVGILGHCLEAPTRAWFPEESINRVMSYAEGVALIQLCFALITAGHLSRRDWFLVNGILAMVAILVGAGTVLGYITDGRGVE